MSSITDQIYAPDEGSPTGRAHLSIGALAERTGVSVAALRAWEQRFGFPVPERSSGTHRRYRSTDVEAVRRVLDGRQAGLSLEAAIQLALATGRPRSIFAAVRDRWPALPARPVSRATMLAVSRAIEDESCAAGAVPVLVGAFQNDSAYRRSRARWRALSRSAAAALVLGTFDATRHRRGGPVEVALGEHDPVVREWAVVTDAPGASACLVGWERPPDGSRHRAFEAMWSVDPAVVRVAALAALAVAASSAPVPAAEAREILARRPVEPMDPARLVALTDRIVGNLDARVRPSR